MKIFANAALALVCASAIMACSGNEGEQKTDNTPAPGDSTVALTKNPTDLPLDRINLPEGFKISVFASDIENARSLARGDKGTIFAGNRSEDKVYAIVDVN